MASQDDLTRFLLVDDHGIVREGIACLLESDACFRVVGMAISGKQAVSAAKKLKPDIVVMDLMLPEMSGLDATELILAALPDTRIVILSASRASEHVFRAFRLGVEGFVLKDAAADELLQAVRTVLRGDRFLSPAIANLLDDAPGSTAVTALERLSVRERQVLHLTVSGMTSAAMATKLCLSRKTVETYRSRIMQKLGVVDHPSLIRFAIEHAMIPM